MSPHRWYRFTGHKLEVTAVSAFFLPIFGNSKIPKKKYKTVLRRLALHSQTAEPAIFHQQIILGGGWTNPSEKYARPIKSFPQLSGWKFQKYLSCHHLVSFFSFLEGGWRSSSTRRWLSAAVAYPELGTSENFPAQRPQQTALRCSLHNPILHKSQLKLLHLKLLFFVSSTKGTNM